MQPYGKLYGKDFDFDNLCEYFAGLDFIEANKEVAYQTMKLRNDVKELRRQLGELHNEVRRLDESLQKVYERVE